MRSLKAHLLITLSIIVSIIAFDQVTKTMARNYFKTVSIQTAEGTFIPVIDPVFTRDEQPEFEKISLRIDVMNIEPITTDLDTVFYQYKPKVKVVGNLFNLQYAENRGAFLSLGNKLSDGVWDAFFTVIPTIFILGFAVFLFRNRKLPLTETIIYSGIVAGGLGNLYDRINYGYVVDFINFDLGFASTGILNIADIPITMGIIYLFIYYTVKDIKAKLAEKQSQKEA